MTATLPSQSPQPTLTLRTVRRILDGMIPPSICSVSGDGVPHVNLLSHAEYVDDEHVALTFQRSRLQRIGWRVVWQIWRDTLLVFWRTR